MFEEVDLVQVSVVLRKTVGWSDWRFDSLSGGQPLRLSKSCRDKKPQYEKLDFIKFAVGLV